MLFVIGKDEDDTERGRNESLLRFKSLGWGISDTIIR